MICSGPIDCTHDGHVGTDQAAEAVVVDVIDSVVNKQTAVDVDEVYASEIPFAEEYDPNA